MEEAAQMSHQLSSGYPSQDFYDHPEKLKNKKKGKKHSKVAAENTCIDAEVAGSENVSSTPHKRKNKNKNPVDSGLDYYSALTGTSDGDPNVSLHGLEKSAKKKHFRHRDLSPSVLVPASPSDFGDVSSQERTDLEDLLPVKKKKKHRHQTVSQEESSYQAISSYTGDTLIPMQSELEDPLKPKKKKKKHEYQDRSHNKDGLSEECDSPDTHRKSKKKKHDKYTEETTAMAGQVEISNMEDERETLEMAVKKKKKKVREGNSSTSVLMDTGDTTLAEQTDPEKPPMFKKKKKKHTHKMLDDENTPQSTGMISTASAASTPKRKRGQEQSDEIMESNMVEPNGDTVLTKEITHTLSKRKKKISTDTTYSYHGLSMEPEKSLDSLETPPRKKKKHSEHKDSSSGILSSFSYAGGTSIVEQTDSEDPQAFQEKKKKKHRDRSKMLEEKGLLMELSDHDVPIVAKKKKKKNHEYTVLLNERNDKSGNLVGDNLKKQLEQECSADLREYAEPEPCGLTLSVSKKKSKKHKRSEMEREDQRLVESHSINDEIEEPQEENFSTPSSTERRESMMESQENPSETEHESQPVCNTDEGIGDQGTNATDSRIDSAVEAVLEIKRQRKVRSYPLLRQKDLELLKEYFPYLEKRKYSTIECIVREDLERVRAAKMKGIPFMTGRFTTEENQRLEQNVMEFQALTGISSGDKLFNSFKYPEEKAMIERVKRMFYFRRRIAEGIPRTTSEVCIRGAKMFDFTSTKGLYSKDEVEQLKRHIEVHGNKWKKIAPLMGRNNVTLQLKASQLRRETNSGTWSTVETNKLIDAIKHFVVKPDKGPLDTIPKCDVYTGIPWVQVEEKVETRNWSQCKIKWSNILLLRMNNGVNVFKGASGAEIKINMIKWLHDHGPAESGQIQWEVLADVLGNFASSVHRNCAAA
ncbi:transcription termination factor 1 isoform X2 [Xenopus laevis]|uniref:Transcription termination factor 1 isoform X2 n=1 Tax=Xenopus laevis TaxID=8355 RepID=A0A8J1LN19_XENLA|nr:transcription termination factor 1 isoform X2 [Xenopus laevis]